MDYDCLISVLITGRLALKVLFINDVYTVGGATKALTELLLELRNRGIEVVVCTSIRDGFNSFLDKEGIENYADGHMGVMEPAPANRIKSILKYVIHKPMYYYRLYRAQRILEKKVDFSKIDIIHSNSARNDLGCLIHKKYNITHIMHIREFGIEDFDCRIYRKNYYEYLNAQCTRFLAVSDAVKAAWVDRGIDPDKIQTLYDGVDFSNFRIKENYNRNNSKLKLVIVGGICDTKGQYIAIEAISKLPEKIRRHVSLDIIGWSLPSYYDHIKKMISEYGVNECVNVLGARQDISNILYEYDIGLMCSKSEGFGRVTAEYMYVGLGVIAANTGASPELVDNKINGLIYDRDNPGDLADKIIRLYNNRDLLEVYGRKASKVARERFSSVQNACEVMEVYETIC